MRKKIEIPTWSSQIFAKNDFFEIRLVNKLFLLLEIA